MGLPLMSEYENNMYEVIIPVPLSQALFDGTLFARFINKVIIAMLQTLLYRTVHCLVIMRYG
jgi:hypothetical protein